jgi:hypothetical protein
MDGLPLPGPPPLLYYDSTQKSPLFFSGAVVAGESPHGRAGSCIYYPQSIINTTSMVIGQHRTKAKIK